MVRRVLARAREDVRLAPFPPASRFVGIGAEVEPPDHHTQAAVLAEPHTSRTRSG